MREFALRFLLALTISGTGAYFTWAWTKTLEKKEVSVGKEVIARIISSNNEVLRRPSEKLVWRSVNTNELLHSGELVRTTNNAEAQIEFIDQGTVIQLDPDSVVEIKRNGNSIDLGFLKGNLFIKSTGKSIDGSSVTLQSGDRKIALTNSEISVTKNDEKGPLEVEVLKGKVTEITGGESRPVEISEIRITRPGMNEPLYVDLKNNRKALIDFRAIDSRYQVAIEAGTARTKLTAVEDADPVAGSKGRIEVPLKAGRVYFRLTAKSTDPKLPALKSSIWRADVRPKIAPELIHPPQEASVPPVNGDFTVTFEWSNPGELDNVGFQLSTSPKFPEAPIPVEDELSREVSLMPGIYYWRVSGQIPGTQEMISSPTRTFELLTGKPKPLAAPILRAPDDKSQFAPHEMREVGTLLTWEKMKAAKLFEMTLVEEVVGAEKPRNFVQTTKENAIRVQNLKAGKYSWSVIAKDDQGQVSPRSATRTFSVTGIPELKWADGRISEKVIYKSEKPTLRAAWTRGPANPIAWRIRYVPESTREPAEEQKWVRVANPQYTTSLPQAGTYRVEAEAVDKDGNLLARTPIRTINFEQAPPLPPPEFAESMPKELTAIEKGALNLAWKPVHEGQAYVLQMKSPDGAVIKTERIKSTKVAYDRLKPGNYTVTLQTVDIIGRVGPEGEARNLTVPEYSDVRAPKIKGLSIK